MKRLAFALLIAAITVFAQEAIFVVVETGDEESVIYKMGPDGSSPTPFFSWDGEPSHGTRDHIREIDISPTGRYIALSSNHDRWHNPSRYNIFMLNSEGTNWRQITPYPAADDYWYSGPTGTISGQVTDGSYYVAFASVTCEGVEGEVTADGTGNYTITGVPPGMRKVFAYTWGGVEMIWGWNLVDVSAGSDNPCDITNIGYSEPYDKDEYTYPTWGTDDNKLFYFARNTAGVYKTTSPWEWSFDSVLVDDWSSVSFYGYDIRQSDGKIVYAIEDEGIYTANANGTGRSLVYNNEGGVTVQRMSDPRWAPDGVNVAFLGHIYNPPDYTGNAVTILNTSTGALGPYFGWGDGVYPSVCAWSPDGSYLLVSAHEGDWSETELYKINPWDLEDFDLVYGPAKIYDADWGIMTPSGIDESPELPKQLAISAYPNPFNSAVTITFDGINAESLPVKVELYDLRGRLIEKSLLTVYGESRESFVWRPVNSLSSGVYLVLVQTAKNKLATSRVVYLK